jgi:peptidoglycan/LPS O-acetylase OafA/YrhL
MVHAYRPDIDGLRAIAVLAVIVFHAFPNTLPGGFVGVDVFFVISGYLITAILLRQLDADQFSITHFYAQRIKRIFPALAFVLIFCLGIGWLALTAGEYKQLGRYTAGGAAFVNNFLFWRDAGYFDTEAAVKPLLHLWSLAIEEQFYLVWPVLLWLCHKLTTKPKAKAILMGTVFAASLLWSYQLVPRNLTADFYSPLSRAWELAVGALLAYWQLHRQSTQLAKPIAELTSFVGALLLVIAFILIDEKRHFPGLWALIPTLGAACLIASGTTAGINQYLLAAKPMVWIGLISYPLYLWHWPLLTFARIFEGQMPSILTRSTLLLVSLIFAWMTYKWLERPIRFSAQTKNRSNISIAMLSSLMFCLLLTGYALTRHSGIPSRHNDRLVADPQTVVLGADRGLLKHECGLDPKQVPAFEWCLSQSKHVPAQYVIIGDSKAEALYYGLARESKPSQHWLLMGTLPAFRLAENDPTSLLQQALQRIEADPNIKAVVLANALRSIFSANKKTGFPDKEYSAEKIDELAAQQNAVVTRLQRMGKRVVFLMDNPTLPEPTDCIEGEMTTIPVLRHLLTRSANPLCSIRYSDHLKGTAAYQAFVQRLKQLNPALQVFNPLPLLCEIASDSCTYFEGKNFLYGYGDHISDYANSKIARQLLPLL